MERDRLDPERRRLLDEARARTAAALDRLERVRARSAGHAWLLAVDAETAAEFLDLARVVWGLDPDPAACALYLAAEYEPTEPGRAGAWRHLAGRWAP
jgi:hypothetical protein